MQTTRGSDVKGWVEPLLGFVQLGLARVVTGLLEGLLVGPEELPIRKQIRVVLQRLKGPKVGPSLVPNSTGQASGFCRVKLGLKGNGLGWPFKPKKVAVPGSTKLVHAEEPKLVSEIRLGALGAESFVPKREVGKSPPSHLGKSPLQSTLPACEDCVGASLLKADGPDARMVNGFSSPVTFEASVVPSSVFGLPVANIAKISSTTLFTFATLAIISLISERAEVAVLLCGSLAVDLQK